MTYETDSATVLKIAHLPCRDIQDFGGFLQSKPVSRFFIPQSVKQRVYHVMEVCHTLKHHVKHLFFNLYYFHFCEFQEVSN
ncbi:hypothetical protein IMSAGC006_02315 [Muribaculaceae bacterium]|nr:hypothetical protein IMSAGC006_02315 [Muribaculaceae bacterium]